MTNSEFLILCLSTFQVSCVNMPGLHSVGDQTQGLLHARQAHPSPEMMDLLMRDSFAFSQKRRLASLFQYLVSVQPLHVLHLWGHSTHQFSLCLQFLPPSSLPSAFESDPSSFGTRYTHCLPGIPHGLCPALPPWLISLGHTPSACSALAFAEPHLHPSSPRAHLLSFCSFFKVQPRTRLTQTLIGCQGSLANTFSSYSTIIK